MEPRTAAELATADGHDRYVPSGHRDLMAAGHEGVYEWATEHLVRQGTRVLDLGCGTGYGAMVFTAAGASYDGVDASPAAVEHALANYAAPGARFFVADVIERLPGELTARSYDIVFSSEVLEHVLDPFAFVRVMAASIRDDGVAFVGTPNRAWTIDNMPEGGLMARSHVMEFTPPALVALLGTVFDEVTVLFRVFPEAAIRSVLVPADRPRLVRGALAFVREVAPIGLQRLRTASDRRTGGRAWSSQDIVWLPAGHPELDDRRSVGLAAVCRAPKR